MGYLPGFCECVFGFLFGVCTLSGLVSDCLSHRGAITPVLLCVSLSLTSDQSCVVLVPSELMNQVSSPVVKTAGPLIIDSFLAKKRVSGL